MKSEVSEEGGSRVKASVTTLDASLGEYLMHVSVNLDHGSSPYECQLQIGDVSTVPDWNNNRDEYSQPV
jgi:hypothetical protein